MGNDALMLLREEEEDSTCYESEHVCFECGEKLTYTDEVYLLEMAEAALEHNGEINCMPLIDENGEYIYMPYLLHFSCWEEIAEVINERTGDLPPRHDKNIVVECRTCNSAIVDFEPFCAATFGEIRVSQRRPGGKSADTIERLAGPRAMCLCCIVHVIEDHFPEWDELLELQPGYDQLKEENENEP